MIDAGIWAALSDDCSDHLADRWDQGLVRCPEIPEFPLLASSGFQTSVVHWMLAAEVASSLDTGQEPDGAMAASFVSEVMRRGEAVWREAV